MTENKFIIRKATKNDAELIYNLIVKLAIYEKMENEVVTSIEELSENIFENNFAEVVIGEENGNAIGFALYFFNFSTFLGKPGLYLEDLFVEEDCRGKGYGKKLLLHLVKIAKEKNCGRMEWSVLNWNEPAIKFYKSLGALPMTEWSVYRLDKKSLEILV
ncbi:L-amino acid N-acyltransferase YncA [Halpernia humi]|uniref:L-amino acid N-acyltransferase YncA n=1 Tax=Halpernia humi TaxID=493375 RepID=A0A1H6B7P2_9FLAO|nr:GNAT family N-acetyltransferase [Halpernia humi]SEG56828.1 L-amino acid N-acyltransferase YncA [Halpernia humi]